MFRFSIRDLLWLTVVVAVSVLLWQSRAQLWQTRVQLQAERVGTAKAVRDGQELLHKKIVEWLAKRRDDVDLNRIGEWNKRRDSAAKSAGIDDGIVTGQPTCDVRLPGSDTSDTVSPKFPGVKGKRS